MQKSGLVQYMGRLLVHSSWYFIPITPMHQYAIPITPMYQYHSDYSDSVYDHYIDSGRYV